MQQLSSELRDVDDTILAKEEKFIKAVSKSFEEEENEEGRIFEVAKEFLPKKKGKSLKESDVQELMEKKKAAGIKQVTPIKSKKKKD